MLVRLLRRGLLRRATLPAPAAGGPGAAPVNGHEILAKVVRLPISTWRYDWDPPEVRHLGPMAQDWKAAFDFGQDERRIPLVDANGVVLVSLQALHRMVADLQAQVDDLRAAATRPDPRDVGLA